MIPLLLQAEEVDRFSVPDVAWSGLVPELILLGGALLLLLLGALVPNVLGRRGATVVTVLTGLATLVSAFILWHDVRDDGPRSILAGTMAVDGFSIFFIVVIASAVVLFALFTDDYMEREGLGLATVEIHVLALLCAIGGIVMASANDLIALFLGLETLSIALYVMAATHLRRIQSQEAAIKYFVLGSFSSAFLLYGIALVYGATGSTRMADIADFLAANLLLENGLLLAGFALMLVGLAFKVAAVPFHFWTPDVYQGSPTPVSGFMASAVKAAAFGAFLRVFVVTFDIYEVDWRPMVWVLAVLTMVVGSFLAVVQSDAKRMLAYSSISHAGFVLVGVEAASADGTSAALFYVLAYTFMALGSFGVLALVTRQGDGHSAVADLRGLGARRPVLAFVFTVFLLAQAGMPLTSGFLAKFYVIGAAVESESYALAIIAMVSSVVAAFLYLRLIGAMYLSEAGPGEGAVGVAVPPSSAVALVVAVAFTVAVGVVPGLVIDFARDAVPVLVAGG